MRIGKRWMTFYVTGLAFALLSVGLAQPANASGTQFRNVTFNICGSGFNDRTECKTFTNVKAQTSGSSGRRAL